jgi:hypothetical protein
MTAFDFGSAFVIRYLLHRREADHLDVSIRPACHDGDRNAHEKDLRAGEIQQSSHSLATIRALGESPLLSRLSPFVQKCSIGGIHPIVKSAQLDSSVLNLCTIHVAFTYPST